MSFLLIPLLILLAILVTFGIVILLARFRNGRYLRPIVVWLSKIPWLRKQFEKASRAAIEKQNPELASAMRKLQRVGPNPDPQRAQAALSTLSAAERRAYLDAVADGELCLGQWQRVLFIELDRERDRRWLVKVVGS